MQICRQTNGKCTWNSWNFFVLLSCFLFPFCFFLLDSEKDLHIDLLQLIWSSWGALLLSRWNIDLFALQPCMYICIHLPYISRDVSMCVQYMPKKIDIHKSIYTGSYTLFTVFVQVYIFSYSYTYMNMCISAYILFIWEPQVFYIQNSHATKWIEKRHWLRVHANEFANRSKFPLL